MVISHERGTSVCGTNPPGLERERARTHQIGEPKNTENELDFAAGVAERAE